MIQINYLGPIGSFSYIATKKLVEINNYDPKDIELVPCNSISTAISNVDTKENCIGIVPIENSIEGIVRDTIDHLIITSSKVLISQEIIIKITNCLITKAKTFNEIDTIVSHPQPLAQCQNYISKNFRTDIKLIPYSSTSEAVKFITDKPSNYAAIGTKVAAELNNLPILAEAINDQPENYTKFVLLDHKITEPTGNDLTSIALSVRNKPGALVNMLVPFSENGINLCRIESRPSKKSLGEYLFFIDFNGHIEDQKVKEAIGKVVPDAHFYRFLGSYPRSSK